MFHAAKRQVRHHVGIKFILLRYPRCGGGVAIGHGHCGHGCPWQNLWEANNQWSLDGDLGECFECFSFKQFQTVWNEPGCNVMTYWTYRCRSSSFCTGPRSVCVCDYDWLNTSLLLRYMCWLFDIRGSWLSALIAAAPQNRSKSMVTISCGGLGSKSEKSPFQAPLLSWVAASQGGSRLDSEMGQSRSKLQGANHRTVNYNKERM